jgi:predicted O-methyltransferase YrrM
VPWFYAVAERDHQLQNPTSPEKIRLLGERLRLGPETQVVDVASGKCGPAVILAREFGCRITAIERAAEFVAAARERVAAAGLSDRIELLEQDAAEADLGREGFDVALCLGASFVWGDLAGTLAALAPAVRAGGAVVVGEPFWRRWPLPDGMDDQGYVPLGDTVRRFEAAGLALETLIASSDDDWDTYESLHWRALEEWLAANPDDEDAPRIRDLHEQHRDEYLSWGRGLLGWAIFVTRKR